MSAHPPARFVAPEGALPGAPVAALAWDRRTHFGTPLTRFVAPQGAPPNAPVAALAWCSPSDFGTSHTLRGPIRGLHRRP
eukprot:3686632-Pyramimonas_sp.AAC.1